MARIVVLVALIALAAGCGKTTAPGTPIAWQSDVDAALASARVQNKPVLVYFGASWDCAAKELEHVTFVDPRVQSRLHRDFVSVMVDATDDENPYTREMQRRFEVVGDPTMIVLGTDAETEVLRFNELVHPDVLLRALDGAMREDAVRSARFTAAARQRAEEARWEEQRRQLERANVTAAIIPLAPLPGDQR